MNFIFKLILDHLRKRELKKIIIACQTCNTLFAWCYISEYDFAKTLDLKIICRECEKR